ncbi:MAG: primase-helicase zinc-binding domain-containing protein [Desulfuromonadaceae bacterium]|nr:primase-helicase zinc-binding domain-containing protein [Desulfuromonadaceae bacterium]MDD2848150.1 primase-helicase zinc-binding domain-containing protein [Desulfuromonadaceae bacterium]MDD4132009.1 primase-helicase zinc-binding domain-containing protein [Desulfuromonadaceae bacterium]
MKTQKDELLAHPFDIDAFFNDAEMVSPESRKSTEPIFDLESFFDQAESMHGGSECTFEEPEPSGYEGYSDEDESFTECGEAIPDDEDYDMFYDGTPQIEHLICHESFQDISELSPKPSFKDVSIIKMQVSNRWLEILRDLAPALKEAIIKKGKHVPCPMHGGRDGFRLFNDADTTGGGVCNTCGFFSDGFSLLHAIHGWPFPETLRRVAQWLDDHMDDKGTR